MVSARHPGRPRRSVTATALTQSWDFLCHRTTTPWSTPADLPAPRPHAEAWEKDPAPSSSTIIQKNLSDFWTSFNPDLDLPTPDDIFPDNGDGLDVLRWHSAPWGTDVWDEDEPLPENADDPPSDLDDTSSQASNTPSSSSSTSHFMSGIPLRHKILPGRIHLLNPKVHKLSADCVYSDAPVAPVMPPKLRSAEGDWYFNLLKNGIHLPRPRDAPKLFKVTRRSPLIDTVVGTWVTNGLLVPNPALKYAQPMFLVPKPDNQVRPIIDYTRPHTYLYLPQVLKYEKFPWGTL